MDHNSPLSADFYHLTASGVAHGLARMTQKQHAALELAHMPSIHDMRKLAQRPHPRQGLIDDQKAKEASTAHLPKWLRELMDTSYTENWERNREIRVDNLNTAPLRSKIRGMQFLFILFSASLPTAFISIVVMVLSGRDVGFTIIAYLVLAGIASFVLMLLSDSIVEERTAKRVNQRYRKWVYYQLSATKACRVMWYLVRNL